MKCSEDPAHYRCSASCSGSMLCCGRTCKAQCYQCQSLNDGTQRTQHKEHPCEKPLYCAHLCGKPCSIDHTCTQTCREPCRQECSHSRCKDYCHTPCSPCQKPCNWLVLYFCSTVPDAKQELRSPQVSSTVWFCKLCFYSQKRLSNTNTETLRFALGSLATAAAKKF